jgi:hypothetical protein
MTDPPSRYITQGGGKSLGRIPGAAQSSAATGTSPRRFRRARVAMQLSITAGPGRNRMSLYKAAMDAPAQSPATLQSQVLGSLASVAPRWHPRSWALSLTGLRLF